MPLNAFVNVAFGDLLKVNYRVDPAVAQRTDAVTLRLTGQQNPRNFLELVRQVLGNYGVIVVEQGNVLNVLPSAALAQQMPTLIRSRAAADVPVGLRPVFQYVDLLNVRPAAMVGLLGDALGGKVRVTPVANGNAILLLGLPDDIRQGLAIVAMLDQPANAGRRTVRISPSFWTVDRLSAKLTEVLRAEGYDVSNRGDAPGLIQFIAVESANALIVLAPDQPALDHVVAWASDLDQPSRIIGQNEIFYYAVKNTKAEQIAPLLNIIGSSIPTTSPTAPGGALAPQAPVAAPGASPAGIGGAASPVPLPTQPQSQAALGSRIIVDSARNALIFRGSAEEWSQIRGLLENLDQPVREALIEVTVAEISLTDTVRFGVEFALRAAGLDGNTANFGTLGGLGLGTNGFSFTVLNGAGQTRAVLNAFANNQNISILSSPRLLAKSGTEARIQVGTEVPITTSQQTTNQTNQGNAAILQSVSYRSTGVILNIKPTVHSNDRVDLEVSQEVSEAQENTVSSISSPAISNRKIATNLSLKDGATVILGGLISENRNASETGIPLLKDIPGVGALFRGQGTTKRKTELIVLITPYVIDSDETSRVVTDAFRRRFPTEVR